MKTYLKPQIKVRKIDNEAILAASDAADLSVTPSNEQITNGYVDAKPNWHNNLWESDEEEN